MSLERPINISPDMSQKLEDLLIPRILDQSALTLFRPRDCLSVVLRKPGLEGPSEERLLAYKVLELRGLRFKITLA